MSGTIEGERQLVGHKVPPDAEPCNPRVKDSLIYFVLPKTRRPVPMAYLTTELTLMT